MPLVPGDRGQSWVVVELDTSDVVDPVDPEPQPYPTEPLEPRLSGRRPIVVTNEDRFPAEFNTTVAREDRTSASFVTTLRQSTPATFSTTRPREDRYSGDFSTSIELALCKQEDDEILLLI